LDDSAFKAAVLDEFQVLRPGKFRSVLRFDHGRLIDIAGFGQPSG